jgi:hypothetical protein
MYNKFIILGLAFLVILSSGFWLSRKGKPYPLIPSSIHKLISLAALAYLIVIVFQVNRVAPLSSIEIASSLITVVLFIALIATGGIMSASKILPHIIQMIHRILPYLAILSTAATLYFLLIHS